MSQTTRFGVAFGTMLIAVIAVVALFAFAAPAHAHDQVLSANPAEGESLEVAPTEVRIEFLGEIQDLNLILNVTNETGADVTAGDVALNGRTISRALATDLPNGQYTVVWRVVSEDGHPINDTYQFAVGEPVAEVTQNHDETSSTNEASSVTQAESNAPSSLDWGRIATFAIAGAFGATVIYVAILALRKRTKNNSE